MFSEFCPCLFVLEIVRVSDWESILESGTIGEPTFWESTQASSSLGYSVFTTAITTGTVNWFQKESVRDERKTMNVGFSGRLVTQMCLEGRHMLLLTRGMAPHQKEGVISCVKWDEDLELPPELLMWRSWLTTVLHRAVSRAWGGDSVIQVGCPKICMERIYLHQVETIFHVDSFL